MFQQHHFPNGLALLAERMDDAESIAFSLRIPCGTNDDPADKIGVAEMLCDMTLRGAGRYDSRDLSRAIENLGCERNETVTPSHTVYGAATLAENLVPSLELLADIVRRPRLPEEQFEETRRIALNEIQSLRDDPARMLMQELERNFYPDPWGRISTGDEESVMRITHADILSRHESGFRPNDAILSVAGRFDWPELLDCVERCFGDWKPSSPLGIVEKNLGRQNIHLQGETSQTHIGIAFPTVPFPDPDYLKAWSAVGILSGGMSSRLFREVREKRGLCYAVGASYATLPHRGAVFCYCGTGSDRAQEALDVMVGEVLRLSEGIEESELARLKIRAKSTLVMQQESAAARSSALARDWFYLGRLRTVREIEEAVEALTCSEIEGFLRSHPAGPFHVATLGPETLELRDAEGFLVI